MNWEIITIGIIVLTALIIVIRNYYRVLSGKEKTCDSCPIKKGN